MVAAVVRIPFCLAVAVLLISDSSARSEDDPRLAKLLQPIISAHEGTVSVAVKNLTTEASFVHRADEPMPTASLIKFPVMIAAYQKAAEGNVDLGTSIELKDSDKVPGSGILTSHFTAGTRLSLRDAIRLMIAFSDNTATNLVVDQIGLPATTDVMTHSQCPNTRLHSKVYRADTSIAPERSQQFGLGSTTAMEMIRLLEQLHKGQLVNADACKAMYQHLLACEDKARFGKHLPKETKIALKTGSVGKVRTAAGIIETPSGPIAICVLTSGNADQSWSDDNAAVRLCAEIARRSYEYFNPPSPTYLESVPFSQELAEGAAGELVEALQRTLNRRTTGTRLSVDGDFGPITRQAVVAFQQSQNLTATGIVGTETWKALGPLILKDDEPQFDVDAVNREVLPQRGADLVIGPPFVTARSWAIGDARTGRVLWHENGDDRRDLASTTKVMTAWVILREAANRPGMLDQIINFSAEADKTAGSTCGLEAGERISVRELLYGLMLPSGNDAAIALAEFAGQYFAPAQDSTEAQQPVARFVAQMNRTAKALEMNQTTYTNPHGLPDAGLRSTAIDQIKLANEAMHNELFRQYVGTRRHAVRVEGQSGYTRNVLWKNTNELLDSTGYIGLKTGTTEPAGACLISVGTRLDEELIVVVLGSSSNHSRYVDTRNLFRWAWQQRGHSD